MEIPSPSSAAKPCRICTHAESDHPAGMFGCVKAIGLCRCPCWLYEPVPNNPPDTSTQHSVTGRRHAKDTTEAWAHIGLEKLANLDGDGARELNGVGFSKNDSEFGRSLAHALRRSSGLLTEKQWAAAVRLARHYHRQIGQPPMAQEAK